MCPLVGVLNPWVAGRRASQSRLDFPAFKVGRGLLVLVLVEEKSTARQQNVFQFFGPRCLCQNFVTVGGVLVLVLVEEKSTARQQNNFRFFGPRCLCQNFRPLLKIFLNFGKAQFSEIWTRLTPH